MVEVLDFLFGLLLRSVREEKRRFLVGGASRVRGYVVI